LGLLGDAFRVEIDRRLYDSACVFDGWFQDFWKHAGTTCASNMASFGAVRGLDRSRTIDRRGQRFAVSGPTPGTVISRLAATPPISDFGGKSGRKASVPYFIERIGSEIGYIRSHLKRVTFPRLGQRFRISGMLAPNVYSAEKLRAVIASRVQRLRARILVRGRVRSHR
jgi:hypothetical protein